MESYLSQSGMQKACPPVRNRSGKSSRNFVDATIPELRASPKPGTRTGITRPGLPPKRRPIRGGPDAGFAE